MSVQFADTMIIHKQDTINKGPNFMLNIVLFTYCIIHVRPASEEGLKIAKTMPKQSLWYTKEAVLATKHFYILEKNCIFTQTVKVCLPFLAPLLKTGRQAHRFLFLTAVTH